MKLKIGGTYKHYKNNNLFKVMALAKDSESLQDIVVYESLFPNPLSRVWTRPYSEWVEEVTDKDGNKMCRFTGVDEVENK